MLSICTVCSNPLSMDFPLKECLESAAGIADEIILINADDIYPCDTVGEVNFVISSLSQDIKNKMKVYYLPWRDSFRKNMSSIEMSVAMSQCTGDYLIWLDADEVLHEKNYEDINKLINIGHDAYSFRTIHFYKDYNHYKTPSGHWYNHRPKLVRNNLGISSAYQSWIENGEIKREFTADLVTWDYKPVHAFSKLTKIPIYHYGYVRDTDKMTKKQNAIEKRHHPDYKYVDKIKWDMKGIKEFKGTHPKPMLERIKNG